MGNLMPRRRLRALSEAPEASLDPTSDRLHAAVISCFAFLVVAVVALACLDRAAWALLAQAVASATLLAALALQQRPRRRHR